MSRAASGRIRRSDGKASALTRPPGESKSTHGGRREGSGRPKQVDAPIRRTVYLDQRHIDLIAYWQSVGNDCSFSEALRGILDLRYVRDLRFGARVRH